MKAKELRELKDDELLNHLNEVREAYYNLRFQLPTGSLERTSELGFRKREIARTLTVIHERELASV